MDVAEEDKLHSWMPVPRYLQSILNDERPITVDEACSIRLILFGQTNISFKNSWRFQGFKFKREPHYALIQKMSGPCGILAGVQAYVVYELIFGKWRSCSPADLLKPRLEERQEALARAIGNILWQAGGNDLAVVAKKGDKIILDDNITSTVLAKDGLLEYIRLKYFRSFESLCEHLCNFVDYVKNDGCILFMYSLLLSHGVDKIIEEMDQMDSSNSLIGDDAFCSQEVVNLILIGKAVTNLFNGDMELNSGGEETSKHRGIPKRAKIGMLSMYDYQDSGIVGTFYKNPLYPIWILNEENHFSVLFGDSLNVFKNPDTFALFYIDSLSRGHTVDKILIKSHERKHPEIKDKKLDPIFQCILSRWPAAEMEFED